MPLQSCEKRLDFHSTRVFSTGGQLKPSNMLQNVPHQIVQSPARLGLSNPNSPSFQSPNSSKLPSQIPPSHHPDSTLSTSKIPSSSLLALLPPLPRAQALLHQMASLASRLFEVSPNRSQWLSSFRGSLPTFLSSQTHPMSPPPPLDPSPSTTKEILIVFTSLQTQLFEAVAELQEIVDLQEAKKKKTTEIRSKDSAILSFANKLSEAERVLDMLVDDYADYRRPKRSKSADNEEGLSFTTTVASRLNLSDILSYAHRISYTTFAPPEFGAGQAPLRGALPPAPQDEQMRASQLYSFADLDVGLPKVVEDKDRVIEPLMEMPPPPPLPAEANPLANPAIQGLIPSNIMVPPGWKPGMPVELPSDLPLPPPGWKPGDPVPLPPLDSLPVSARFEEQPPRPAAPHVLPKLPEPIQVPHVQLDILDQDDDSSDYSSEGSSDDEV
ncbi:hypothetical protein Nepgr_028555 [Nepenthes gracilis]|uniref:Mediator of RNA polymerase II transcription subunit 4 n=1 Tax=Nepenthes gracilis TaxID=150966 RepID=A0AAD3Y283_NEPGR|nr:hypothetical protein Nepgr_028555 [Nepenthes gracilis]